MLRSRDRHHRVTRAAPHGRSGPAVQAVVFDMDGVLLDSEPLHRDVVNEMLAVQAFNKSIRLAAAEFQRDPLGSPLISNWNRVTSAVPDFFEMLKEAVDRDAGGR